MGVIADSGVLIFAFGTAVAVTSIVVSVFSTDYLDTYPNDTKDPGQKQTVYYSVLYVRILSILTSIFVASYLAWLYVDSRNRVFGKKDMKLTAVSMKRIQNSNLVAGAKSAGHRKKLAGGLFVLFMLWVVPALIMCFQGWLFKYKKPDHNTTLVNVCADKGKSKTCDKLYATGLASLLEVLWILLAFISVTVSLMSKSPEADLEHNKVLSDLEKFKKDYNTQKKAADKLNADLAFERQNRPGQAQLDQANNLAAQRYDELNRANQAALQAQQQHAANMQGITGELNRFKNAEAQKLAARQYAARRGHGRHHHRHGRHRPPPSPSVTTGYTSSQSSSSGYDSYGGGHGRNRYARPRHGDRYYRPPPRDHRRPPTPRDYDFFRRRPHYGPYSPRPDLRRYGYNFEPPRGPSPSWYDRRR